MATYEKGFVDRKSNSSEKRIINVSKQTIYSNGLMELEADVSRGDNNVTTAGTRLNAAEMNKAVLDLIYNELFGIKINKDLHSINIVGSEQFSFEITCNERPLFANCVCNNGIDFGGEILFSGNGSMILIDLIPDVTVLTSKSEFDFKIELYTDSQCNKYLTSITGHINYSPTSESSND